MRAAIVLAAGLSRRFGRGDKLTALIGGKPLLLHAIRRARESGAGRVVVVTPPGRMRIPQPAGIARIVAADHRAGMGASLAAGLSALRPIEREVLVFLGDMPMAGAPRRMRLMAGFDAVRPAFAGLPGHPLLVRKRAALRAKPSGDQGLAAGLGRVKIVAGGAGAILDIDTMARLRAARRAWIRRR